MTWVVILALVVWLFVLSRELGDARSRLAGLERRIAGLREGREAETPAEVAQPAAPLPPLVPVTPPRPVPAAAPAPEPEDRAFRPSPAAEGFRLRPERPATPAGQPFRETARAWLEENGLAWAGGAALALGGLFLVTYAAQRGMFTPPLRIAAALVTGLVLLGVSEWLRGRAERDDEHGHRLAAALAAGAGAATLYGAVWASYWLYALIGLGVAGGGLGVVSLGLLALAFRHGEPLAILAIGGGFLAPVVTGPEQWAAPALTAYLSLITLTGYAVAGGRRWGQAGLATLAGAALWACAGYAAGGHARVAALAVGPVVLACAALEWRRRRGEAVELAGGTSSFTLLPVAGVVVGAALLAGLWIAADTAGQVAVTSAGLGSIALAAVGAFGVRRGLVPAPAQALTYLAGAGAVIVAQGPGAWPVATALAIALAGVAAGPGRKAAHGLWAATAAPVVLLIALTLGAALFRGADWVPEAAAALLLFGCAAAVARRAGAPVRDLPLAVWLWTSGGAALFALAQGLDARILPLGAAALSLGAAALHARLGWRGFAAVMTAAAIGSLAALISPELFEVLRIGRLRWFELAAVAGGSTALVAAGAWLAGRNDRPRESAEALQTGALLIGLAGIFVLIRLWSTAGAVGGGPLDPFMAAALRTVLILAAGLTAAQAVRADSSVIGRWRGQVLLGLGLAHGVLLQVLGYNPLLAWWTPAVAGPPLADALFLGYLAPAALLGFATVKKVSVRRELLAVYAAGAGGFGFVWAAMELRRLFQGASLHAALDPVGRAEWAAYGVLVLASAAAVLLVGQMAARRTWTLSPLAGAVTAAGRIAGWAALALAVWIYGYAASSWWGPIERPLAGHLAAGLLFALYAAGAAAAFVLARLAAQAGDPRLGRAARLAVPAILFGLLNLLVRYGFRGLDMRPDLREASLETWTFSAVWGLYGFGLLVYGAARRSVDLRVAGLTVLIAALAKIFLFDMARLDGVVRAGSFLAVGALLLAAAVLVRRLSGPQGLSFGLGRARPAGAPERGGG